MTYLIISIYDDGVGNWSIKSSDGFLSKNSSTAERATAHEYLQKIANTFDKNTEEMTADSVVPSVHEILFKYDFVLICEDGKICILRDKRNLFHD